MFQESVAAAPAHANAALAFLPKGLVDATESPCGFKNDGQPGGRRSGGEPSGPWCGGSHLRACRAELSGMAKAGGGAGAHAPGVCKAAAVASVGDGSP